MEQAVARSLLTQAAARISRGVGLDEDLVVARSFVKLTTTSLTGPWRLELQALIEHCITVSRIRNGGAGATSRSTNAHVRRITTFIEIHYPTSTIRLRDAARAVHVSPAHLARILAQHTGTTFLQQLRRRRVSAAQERLAATALTIKEIAAAVGYDNPRQLQRDIKRLVGMTPSALRQSLAAAADAL